MLPVSFVEIQSNAFNGDTVLRTEAPCIRGTRNSQFPGSWSSGVWTVNE